MFEGNNRIEGSNQGESSNEWKGDKTPFQMARVENEDGNESGVSDTAGLGSTAGETMASKGPQGNDGINGTASTENRAAKYKYPQVSDDQGAGANQYE